jgi:hypothetical protein
VTDRRPDNPEPPERPGDDRHQPPDVPDEAALQPQQRDHPAAEHDEAYGDKRRIRAQLGLGVPAPNQSELLPLVEAGTLAKVEWHTLERDPEHATSGAPRYLTNRISETIGEKALQVYIADKYPGADREQFWPPPGHEPEKRREHDQPTSLYLDEPDRATGPHAFDHVEVIRGAGPDGTDLFLVGEAKGGLNPDRTGKAKDVHLSRVVNGVGETEVVRAEQGSLPYFQSVAMAMARNADPAKRAVGEALLKADLSQINYVRVEAKIGHGAPVPTAELTPRDRRYLESELLPADRFGEKQYRKELIKGVTVREFILDEGQLDGGWKVDR